MKYLYIPITNKNRESYKPSIYLKRFDVKSVKWLSLNTFIINALHLSKET